MRAFGGEQHQPARTGGSLERLEPGMPRDRHVIDVIHRRTADAAIVPSEPERFDQVHRRPETGAKAQDRADISSDFRFEQGDTHRP